jgi:hypothetical protein
MDVWDAACATVVLSHYHFIRMDVSAPLRANSLPLPHALERLRITFIIVQIPTSMDRSLSSDFEMFIVL